MFSIVYSVISFSVTEYRKQPCIIPRNLPFKGFSGCGYGLYTTIGSENFCCCQDVGYDEPNVSENVD